MRIDRKGSALAMLSGAGFGTLAIFGKLALSRGGLALNQALALRFLGAAVLLLLWRKLRSGDSPSPAGAWRPFLLGGIGYAGQTILFFGAALRVGAGGAALLLYLYPAIVTLLAWAFRGERPSGLQKLALVASFFGTVLCTDLSGGRMDPVGIAFGLGSALWYSLYLMVAAKLLRDWPPLPSTNLVCLGAGASFVALAVFDGAPWAPTLVELAWLVPGLSLLATALPILCIFEAISRIGPALASVLSTTEPVVAVLLGCLAFGETFASAQWAGAGLVLASVVAIQLNSPRRR